MFVVSPFQGLILVVLFTQGDAARLAPLRCALGWCVEAPWGRKSFATLCASRGRQALAYGGAFRRSVGKLVI